MTAGNLKQWEKQWISERMHCKSVINPYKKTELGVIGFGLILLLFTLLITDIPWVKLFLLVLAVVDIAFIIYLYLHLKYSYHLNDEELAIFRGPWWEKRIPLKEIDRNEVSLYDDDKGIGPGYEVLGSGKIRNGIIIGKIIITPDRRDEMVEDLMEKIKDSRDRWTVDLAEGQN